MEKANLASLAYLDNVIYNDGELAFFDNIDGSRISDYTVQLEVFTIALVTEGRATLLFNGERYEAKRNDLLICPPHSVIGSGPKAETSRDIAFASLLPISSGYFRLRRTSGT